MGQDQGRARPRAGPGLKKQLLSLGAGPEFVVVASKIAFCSLDHLTELSSSMGNWVKGGWTETISSAYSFFMGLLFKNFLRRESGSANATFRLLFCGLAFLAMPLLAGAQDAADGASELSFFVGSHLPNQIDGVTEILPVFGGRYGLPLGGGIAELGLSNSHAEGVDFSMLSASMRANLPTIDQFMGSVYGGLDINFFRPAGAENRTTETGVHVGAGLLMHASSTLWFRGDLKFAANPGTSLMLLFGIVFRASDAGGQ